MKNDILKQYDVVVLKHGKKWEPDLEVGIKCPECGKISQRLKLPLTQVQLISGYLICQYCKCEFSIVDKINPASVRKPIETEPIKESVSKKG